MDRRVFRKNRLPPLKSLVVFEAVARLKSFKAASEELCITPSAVSQQVNNIESFFGKELLERGTRGIKLRPAGEKLFRYASDGLTLLRQGSAAVNSESVENTIAVSTTMSLASNWLSGVILEFNNLFINIDVVVDATDVARDPDREEYDFLIKYLRDPDMDNSVTLFQDFYLPVCRPGLADILVEPEDVLNHLLVEYRWSGFDSSNDPSWDSWRNTYVPNVNGLKNVQVVPEEHIALSLAEGSDCIALVGYVAAKSLLSKGRLRIPFEKYLPHKYYTLIEGKNNDNVKCRDIFRDFLLKKTRDFDIG